MVCDICGEQFRLKTAFILHKLDKHKLNEKKLRISTIVALRTSIEVLYSSDSECEYEIFLNIERLPRKRNEKIDENAEIPNGECNQIENEDSASEFNEQNESLSSELSNIEQLRPFCHTFQRDFSSNNASTVHPETTSVHSKSYQCYLCKQPFGRLNLIINHLERLHPVGATDLIESKSAKIASRAKIPCKGNRHCIHCDKTFTCHRNYLKHLSRLKNGKPFFCKACATPFDSKTDILRHRQNNATCKSTPTIKMYLCNFCGKYFGRQSTLNVHLRSHMNDKPHKCEFCHRGFATASQMRQHTNIHTGVRPFVCSVSVCKKAFSSSSALYQHQSNVHEPRALKCPHCDKMFSRKEHRE